MRVGIAADHGGFKLKAILTESMRGSGHEVVDFGAQQLNPKDDYPDYVLPLARAVAAGEVDRGVALCGSGVGASVAANKIPGVRAGLINHVFSAHQGVEDAAQFSGDPRHERRLAKVQAIENQKDGPLKAHSKRLNRLAKTPETIDHTGNDHENRNQSDRETTRYGTELVAGQYYQEPVRQRDFESLHSGALGNGAHLESDDLRPRDQE
jgi:ribose 5-phosphate isomerase B